MNLEEKIARTALAVLRSGPVAHCTPGLAARRPSTAQVLMQPALRQRLVLESGGIPVVPPSSRRELWI